MNYLMSAFWGFELCCVISNKRRVFAVFAAESRIYPTVAAQHDFPIGNMSGWWKNRDKIF